MKSVMKGMILLLLLVGGCVSSEKDLRSEREKSQEFLRPEEPPAGAKSLAGLFDAFLRNT